MAKIKVIIKRPDEEYGHVTHISARLENLQNTVGGYIETVPVIKGVILICNEDGKLNDLEPNIWLHGDLILGTVIICGMAGENFSDIPISLQQWKNIVDNCQRIINEKYANNKEPVKLSIGSRLESVTFTEMKRKAFRLSSQGYGVSIIGLSDIEHHVLTITALPERSTDESGR